MKYIYLLLALTVICATQAYALNDSEVIQITDALYPIIHNNTFVQNVTIEQSINASGDLQNITNALYSAVGNSNAATQSINEAVARMNASIAAIPVNTNGCGNITLSLSADQLNNIYAQTANAVKSNPAQTCVVDPASISSAVNTELENRFAQQQTFFTGALNNAQGIAQMQTNYVNCLNDNSNLKASYYAANLSVNNSIVQYQIMLQQKDDENQHTYYWLGLVTLLLLLTNAEWLYSYVKRTKYT